MAKERTFHDRYEQASGVSRGKMSSDCLASSMVSYLLLRIHHLTLMDLASSMVCYLLLRVHHLTLMDCFASSMVCHLLPRIRHLARMELELLCHKMRETIFSDSLVSSMVVVLGCQDSFGLLGLLTR